MHLKNLIKNKWTINNLYPYIWTHPFWHLWASWFFAVLLVNKKTPINCVEDQPFNIPTKCGSNWFSEFRELDLNYGPLWRRWTPSDVNTRCCQTSHLFRRRGARYLLPTDVNKLMLLFNRLHWILLKILFHLSLVAKVGDWEGPHKWNSLVPLFI
jgi:hypothetical protein